ncbi:hypothetical protein QIS74_01943 [Colletotrichum tabaci]|uniref:Uncharacterized protein n=1 Tax=Colletotrichum tabaci TaxID=1209068 RepID=A0AAV9TQR5_9PEZI
MPVKGTTKPSAPKKRKLAEAEPGQRKVDSFFASGLHSVNHLQSAQASNVVQSTSSVNLLQSAQASTVVKSTSSVNFLQSAQANNAVQSTSSVNVFQSAQASSSTLLSASCTGSSVSGAGMVTTDNFMQLSLPKFDDILHAVQGDGGLPASGVSSAAGPMSPTAVDTSSTTTAPDASASVDDIPYAVQGDGGLPASGVSSAAGLMSPAAVDTSSTAGGPPASAVRSRKGKPVPTPPNRTTWDEKTWIENISAKSMKIFAEAIEFFTQPRTEQDLANFLQKIPEHSGWIHPLLPNFQRHRGKEAILTILLCPKMTQRMDFDSPVPDKDAFTHSLLFPVGKWMEEVTGLPSIAMDFRKECRRRDGHCLSLSEPEYQRLSVATQVELLIARNVYDITFLHTITWSRDVSYLGKGVDIVLQLEPNLLGSVYRIPFHPRTFTLIGFENQVGQSTFRHIIETYVFPILETITGVEDEQIERVLWEAWGETNNHLLRTVVVSGETKVGSISSLPDTLSAPNNLSRRTVDKTMLSLYALMANSPMAKQFESRGLLPTWFLKQPREIPVAFGRPRRRNQALLPADASAVDGDGSAVLPLPPLSAADSAETSAAPSCPNTSSVEGDESAVFPYLPPSTEDPVRMMPNPIFDIEFINNKPASVVFPYYMGLTGIETIANKQYVRAQERRRKLERTESEKEAVRKQAKIDNANRKAKMADPEFRAEVNATRRAKRAMRKELGLI